MVPNQRDEREPFQPRRFLSTKRKLTGETPVPLLWLRRPSGALTSVQNSTHQIDPPGTNNFCASRKVVFVSSSVQERLNTQSTPCCKSGSLSRVIFWPHRSQATTMLR